MAESQGTEHFNFGEDISDDPSLRGSIVNNNFRGTSNDIPVPPLNDDQFLSPSGPRTGRQEGRLPMINQNQTMQQANNSFDFNYQDSRQNQSVDYEESMKNRRRDEYNPNKTAGQVSIKSLHVKDVNKAKYEGRQAYTLIEAEMRQFDKIGQKFEQARKYVEQIITGEFLRVQKDVNLGISENIEDAPHDKYEADRLMIRHQILWINRVNALFNGTLGILAGMSLLHLLFLFSISDQTKFLTTYAVFARNINFLFLILVNFCLIFGITLALVYKQKSEEKVRYLDGNRHKLRQDQTIQTVLSFVIGLAWILLFSMPYFTNQIHYKPSSQIDSQTLLTMKICYAVVNLTLIVAWFISAAFTKASITDMDLEPDSDEDDFSDGEHEDSTGIEDSDNK